jgi:16S rRNA (guanine966-N2)-methyltransferase
VRITGGRARGIRLVFQPGKLRPTTDALREALFSALGRAVEGASFADLFAGTGSYGLEAISRGARRGDFVENRADAVAAIRDNLGRVAKSAGVGEAAYAVHRADAFRWNRPGCRPDLIFFDPPYALLRSAPSPCARLLGDWASAMGPAALLVLELPLGLDFSPPAPLRCLQIVGSGNGQGSPRALILGREDESQKSPLAIRGSKN